MMVLKSVERKKNVIGDEFRSILYKEIEMANLFFFIFVNLEMKGMIM
jgi:hypothetical protein